MSLFRTIGTITCQRLAGAPPSGRLRTKRAHERLWEKILCQTEKIRSQYKKIERLKNPSALRATRINPIVALRE